MREMHRPPLDPVKDTPERRLHLRVTAAVEESGEARVAALAVRMLTGRLTVEDVSSGAVAALTPATSPSSELSGAFSPESGGLSGEKAPQSSGGGASASPASGREAEGPFPSASAVGAGVLRHVWARTADTALLEAVGHDEPATRAAALETIALRPEEFGTAPGTVGPGAAEETLRPVRTAADDPHPRVRAAAARALGELTGTRGVDASRDVLAALLMDLDTEVSDAAEVALFRLADRLDRPDLRPD